jgi:hypothetical protein
MPKAFARVRFFVFQDFFVFAPAYNGHGWFGSYGSEKPLFSSSGFIMALDKRHAYAQYKRCRQWRRQIDVRGQGKKSVWLLGKERLA